MKKYCSECGIELQEDDKFCLECGTKVIDDDKTVDRVRKDFENLEREAVIPPAIQNKSKSQETKSNRHIKNPINSSKSISGNSKNNISFNKNILYVLGGLLLIAIVLFMVLKESDEQNEAIKKLDEIELKIQEAIKNKDYDHALVIVEQFKYSVNLNYKENQKIAQQYDDKRNSLRSTIIKLKKQLQSATSGTGTLQNTTDDGSLKVSTPITDYDIITFINLFNSDVLVKNIDGILRRYANEVDYFGKGRVNKNFIMNDKFHYFKRWDDVNYKLVESSLSISDLPNYSKLVVFNFKYSVYSSERNKRSVGIAQSFLKIRKGEKGLEIYDEKQKIISQRSEEIEVLDENENLNNLTQNIESLKQIEEEPVYFVAVEEMPEPIGGIQAIQSKIVYPEIAKRAGVEGRIYVLVFVDEFGNVTDAKVQKGIGAGCDEAALDAVKKTKFKPGKQRGKAVKVQVSIPVLFRLT